MKKIILTHTALAFMIGALLTGCSTPEEKVEKAEVNVTDANKDLNKAQDGYLADVENCRQETANKIATNDKSIAEFKARIEHKKKNAKADYQKKLAELEQKNNDMKKKMDDYKAEGKENWEKFKTEFNHDMNELGKAFKDLTVKNTK